MTPEMRDRLEAAGFRETTVQEFLGLTDEECRIIETRLALARLLRKLRKASGLTQAEAAMRLGTDQSNFSKAETTYDGVTIDWMIRAAYGLGADRKQVGRAISSYPSDSPSQRSSNSRQTSTFSARSDGT